MEEVFFRGDRALKGDNVDIDTQSSNEPGRDIIKTWYLGYEKPFGEFNSHWRFITYYYSILGANILVLSTGLYTDRVVANNISICTTTQVAIAISATSVRRHPSSRATSEAWPTFKIDVKLAAMAWQLRYNVVLLWSKVSALEEQTPKRSMTMKVITFWV